MDSLEITKLVVGSTGLLGILASLVFLVFRTGKIVEKVNTIDKKVSSLDDKMASIQIDLSDVKERVAFMEAFIFFSEFKAETNTRSEAAKKMWERRKMKKMEAKGK